MIDIFRYEEGELWLIVNSGECALAVLSIDGLTIGMIVLNSPTRPGLTLGNEKLHVRLKSPDWAYALKPPISVKDLEDEADQIVNCTSKSDQTAAFEFDGRVFIRQIANYLHISLRPFLDIKVYSRSK